MRLELDRTELRFRVPLLAAYGLLPSRELIGVRIEDDDGAVGRGEAAPLEPYDGVSTDRVHAALRAYAPVLARTDHATPSSLLDACRAVADIPQALAAIDMALWDPRRAAARAGRSAPLLRDEPAEWIPANARRSSDADIAAAARGGRARGGSRLRVRQSQGRFQRRRRARRVPLRHAMGPEASLRLDANGAWSLPVAERMLTVLSRQGLELVEEPVRGLRDAPRRCANASRCGSRSMKARRFRAR